MSETKYGQSTKRISFSYYSTIYAFVLILLLIVAIVGWKTDIPVKQFTRDIAAIAEVHPFFGLISNIGILLWCTAASICLFAFALLQNSKNNNITVKIGNFRFFLLFSGFITLILMFDDLFLLHEEIFPSLNISESAVYCSYMAIILFYILRFRKTIFKTEWSILFLGFLCFGASITIDFFLGAGSKITFLEDGFKLLGIASWFGYFVRLCFQILKNTIDPNFNYDRRGKLLTKQALKGH